MRSFGQCAAATCAAPPSVIAGEYAASNCKPLPVIKCKWRHINVVTFNLLSLLFKNVKTCLFYLKIKKDVKKGFSLHLWSE